MTNSSSKIRDELWAEACRREEVLRDLMRLHPGRFPETAAPDACVALGVSRATLFRLIERLKTEQTASARHHFWFDCGTWRLQFETGRGPHAARTRTIYQPGNRRSLPPLNPFQPETSADRRLDRARRGNATANACGSHVILGFVSPGRGTKIAARRHSSLRASVLVIRPLR